MTSPVFLRTVVALILPALLSSTSGFLEFLGLFVYFYYFFPFMVSGFVHVIVMNCDVLKPFTQLNSITTHKQ